MYRLPFPRGFAYKVTQGFDGDFSHKGRQSVDWGIPVGELVCASRSGRVVRVTDSFKKGGVDVGLKNKANIIKILHADGTVRQYAHLQAASALVKVGQRVTAGTPIARSGIGRLVGSTITT